MAEQVKTDVRELIMRRLNKYGSSIQWLSDETGIGYNSLYAILKLRTTNISNERLALVNKVLGTNFKK